MEGIQEREGWDGYGLYKMTLDRLFSWFPENGLRNGVSAAGGAVARELEAWDSWTPP